MRDDDRLVGIEGLRFLAALAVLIWHYQNFMFTGVDTATLNLGATPFRALLAPFYAYGYAGVELFWCISGFIFTWKYEAAINTGRVAFGRFLTLRFSRLYPLHFLTLILAAILNAAFFADHGYYFVYAVNDLKHFLLNLAFASGWGFQDERSFNGPIWSVSVEILVYLLFFAVARKGKGSFWRDIGIIVAASIIYPALRRFAGIKLEVFGAITFFYIGAAACRLHDLMVRWPTQRQRMAIAGLLAAVLIPAGLVALHVLKIAGASLVMFPSCILFVQLAIRPHSSLGRGLLTWFGNLTYSSYLLHFPLQLTMVMVMQQLGIPIEPLFHGPWLMLIYLGLVFALSALVYAWFERPAQSWLRGLSRPRIAAA